MSAERIRAIRAIRARDALAYRAMKHLHPTGPSRAFARIMLRHALRDMRELRASERSTLSHAA